LSSTEPRYNLLTRIIHLGLMLFGTLAWLTSGLADDHDQADHLGFTVHSWIGMSLVLFIFARIVYGFFGPPLMRFANWLPYTKERLVQSWTDIRALLKLQMPERPAHEGIAGLVQTFGLLVFSWSAITGSLMFILLEPGTKAKGFVHFVKELHEISDGLIPLFLILHVGAVILHALLKHPIWRRMF